MPEFKMTEREARLEAKRLKQIEELERKAKVLDYARKNPGTPIYYYRQRWGVGAVVAKRWLKELNVTK